MQATSTLRGPLLLCYHAVSEGWPAPLAVTPAQLREHVALLVRRKYRGVSHHAAVTERPGPRAVAITFDDAFRSVFDHALPILEAAGFPATVFAPTDFIGRERPMSWPGIDGWLQSPYRDELIPMSWEELRILADAGWEIGSHTRSHPRLTGIDDEALDSELRGSRKEIESRLGQPCRSLAYPYGVHDPRVVNAAGRAGYTAAATLPRWLPPHTGPLNWPRININRIDGPRRFRLKISAAARKVRAI